MVRLSPLKNRLICRRKGHQVKKGRTDGPELRLKSNKGGKSRKKQKKRQAICQISDKNSRNRMNWRSSLSQCFLLRVSIVCQINTTPCQNSVQKKDSKNSGRKIKLRRRFKKKKLSIQSKNWKLTIQKRHPCKKLKRSQFQVQSRRSIRLQNQLFLRQILNNQRCK